MSNVVEIKGAREAPKSARSSMETLLVSLDQVTNWRVPLFQRPVRVNAKVLAMAEDIKSNGVAISGVVTLGKLGKAGELYVVDGQHRLEAFKISGLTEIIVDVRVVHFDTMAEMADEFVALNSALVRMRPDDILRGLEPALPMLQRIRSECPFVGYDSIRRNQQGSAVVSMSVLIRSWTNSGAETPVAHLSGRSVSQVAAQIDEQSASNLIRFMHIAETAWGRDPEYYRLWGVLNMTLCMWLYRRVVLDKTRSVKRAIVLTEPLFRQCMMSVSTSSRYIEWLQGRIMSDRDRSPAFTHLKAIFSRRLVAEGVVRPMLPSPAWVSR